MTSCRIWLQKNQLCFYLICRSLGLINNNIFYPLWRHDLEIGERVCLLSLSCVIRLNGLTLISFLRSKGYLVLWIELAYYVLNLGKQWRAELPKNFWTKSIDYVVIYWICIDLQIMVLQCIWKCTKYWSHVQHFRAKFSNNQ